MGDSDAVADLVRSIGGRARTPTTGVFWLTVVDSHLAAGHAFLGEVEQALALNRSALDVATRMRFRPEVALTRLQLAELLLEHYPEQQAEAKEHLDFAIGEFREMKMQPSLERALRHRRLLKA